MSSVWIVMRDLVSVVEGPIHGTIEPAETLQGSVEVEHLTGTVEQEHLAGTIAPDELDGTVTDDTITGEL